MACPALTARDEFDDGAKDTKVEDDELTAGGFDASGSADDYAYKDCEHFVGDAVQALGADAAAMFEETANLWRETVEQIKNDPTDEVTPEDVQNIKNAFFALQQDP